MRKWMAKLLRKFVNRGIKIARVNLIIVTKSIDLLLFCTVLGVRCDRRRFSVFSPFIEKSMIQFNHYVCRQLAMESPHDTNRLRYFTSDLIYTVLKSKIFVDCNAKEFGC